MRITLENATSITRECFHGEPASCSHGCPYFFDIRTFLERTSAAKWNLAYKLLRETFLFPSVVCAACGHTCLAECQRVRIGDEAVDIPSVVKACVRLADAKAPPHFRQEAAGKSVAVIGAGLSGLSCALRLAQKKYAVHVFDARDSAGGSLRSDSFAEDIALQFSTVDVEFRLGRKIESPDELSGYDAVFVATGAGGDDFGLRDSWNERTSATDEAAVFLGGELVGMPRAVAAAETKRASKSIEAYLQTGGSVTGDEDAHTYKKHYLSHEGAAKIPRVTPVSEEAGYTAGECVKESARCLQCDCRLCIDSCEMLASFRKAPQKIAIEAYNDTTANPPFSSCTLTRETFSCNICGYCKQVCPVDIDMGRLFRLARAGRVEVGTDPKAFHNFWLRDFDFASGEGAFVFLSERYRAGDTGKRYMFFPGCKLAAFSPDTVSGALKLLMALCEAEGETAVGMAVNCCGAPLIWAGEEEKFPAHAGTLRDIWNEYGRPVFVFGCPYCATVFEDGLPEIERISIFELFAKYRSGRDYQSLILPKDGEYAMFHPCASASNDAEREAAKIVAGDCGITCVELTDAGKCCGYGGHIGLANIGLQNELAEARVAQSDLPYLVRCANCYEMFSRQGKECLHLL
ncbi:MAG: NAD(P)-binding protein, partial [Clostridiales Family XIII bacterium]|nr:NAD(P)-binding protein [Clostridiales Family XIII bacterium]